MSKAKKSAKETIATNDKWLNNVAEFCIPKKREVETDEEYAQRSSANKYLKIIKDFSATKDMFIRMEKYEDSLKKLFEKGFIKTQEEFDKKMERAAFVKYVCHIGPQTSTADVELNDEWINNAVSIQRDKNGGFYIKVKESFAIKKGGSIPLKKPTEKLNDLKAKGMITEQVYQERVDKLKVKDEKGNLTNNFWLLYEGSIPPHEEGNKE